MSEDPTTRLQHIIERLKAGDDAARWELLEHAFGRLRGLASKILGDYPRVKEEGLWKTTDVAAEARLRLAEALQEVRLADKQHFFRLAAQKIRWFLLDLVRRLPGNAPGDRESPAVGRPVSSRPDYEEVIVKLLELLPELPEDQYAVLDLDFSLGFDTAEIAAALGVNERTVRRIRRRANEAIARELGNTFPGLGEGLVQDQE